MEQLLAHLVGDYILQSHDMATNKTKSKGWCLYHAIMYTVPFIFLTQSIWALAGICIGHYLIDRNRFAKYVIIIKNVILGYRGKAHTETIKRNRYLTYTGYPAETPDYISFWLFIITDNTLHLLWNYFILSIYQH